MNIMTTLIFIIVSRLHAFFLVVAIRSFLHRLISQSFNVQATVKTKQNKVIDQYVLMGLAKAEESNDEIKARVTGFISEVAKDKRIQQAYMDAIEATMRSPLLYKDVAPKGPYWSKLTAGASNAEVTVCTSLNELLSL